MYLSLSIGAHAYEPLRKSISELEADLDAGRSTSVELVKRYMERISRINPRLRAIIAVNPDAEIAAAASDEARRVGRARGPLWGIPILIKDNIETADSMPTTAGSLALKDNMNLRDAPLVARLRAAGAIILGKTNLSEWANARSSYSISGWSATGGQARNPFALDRSPCGSSAGSGAAAAAELAAAAIGTETDGSITCPASMNGLVGLKPTVGLVSRTYIVPTSHSQDTAGPMTRSVRDAAVLLNVLASTDPQDPSTTQADSHKIDYLAALKPGALRGARIGVMCYAANFQPETELVFNRALEVLRAAGAILVEIEHFPGGDSLDHLENIVVRYEMKTDLASYLASVPVAHSPSRNLADLIAFNRIHAKTEMALFGQDEFERAEEGVGVNYPAYLDAKSNAYRIAGPEGIDAMLAADNLMALVAPTFGPAWLIDPVMKDHYLGGVAGQAAAVAGYPHLTVPMGQVDGLPVGLSFIGSAWSEATLLSYGFAFEQMTHDAIAPTLAATVVTKNMAAKANIGDVCH